MIWIIILWYHFWVKNWVYVRFTKKSWFKYEQTPNEIALPDNSIQWNNWKWILYRLLEIERNFLTIISYYGHKLGLFL